jgi:hypothetical protein
MEKFSGRYTRGMFKIIHPIRSNPGPTVERQFYRNQIAHRTAFWRYAALSLIGRRGWSGTTLNPAALKTLSKASSLSYIFASCIHVLARAM